jgi:hypothetical protein
MASSRIEEVPPGSKIACPELGCPAAAVVELPRHQPMARMGQLGQMRPQGACWPPGAFSNVPDPGPEFATPAAAWVVVGCPRHGRTQYPAGTAVEVLEAIPPG